MVVTSLREDPDVKAAYALCAKSYAVKPVDSESFNDAMGNLGLYRLPVNEQAKQLIRSTEVKLRGGDE